MRSVFLPVSDAQGSSWGLHRHSASFCIDSVGLLSSRKDHFLCRPFSRKRNNHTLQKTSVVCFQDLNFQLRNVSKNLQHLGVHLAKLEHYARWREYLQKGDVVDLERFQFLPAVRTNAFWEAANIPFAKSVLKKETDDKDDAKPLELDLFFSSDQTVDSKTPKGDLSPAAINSIEQFSRMNGLTGKKMKANFDSHAPVAIQNEARNLVEYCCFRYLARCGADFHPSIKDAAFRRLTFITMLAWQQPYSEDAQKKSKGSHPPDRPHANNRMLNLVGEDAFVRIAPAIAGAADRPTAHHLFKALTGDNEGLSLSVWDRFLLELSRVHEERVQYRMEEGPTLGLAAKESVLCVGANKRQPVQMWNKNNIAWPGRLTLTDQALYFEANGLLQHQKPIRLDLEGSQASAKRIKVGPLGAPVFDSAISITPSPQSEPWVLEFVDFSGEGRRDVWYAFISEILSIHSFIRGYGPASNDPLLHHVYGSKHGRTKALKSAINGIARVQAVQSTLGRALEHPERLLQFSYLLKAPCGDLVLQTLAVGFWGGHLEPNSRELSKVAVNGNGLVNEDAVGTGLHAVDVDGSVYLRRWMTSPTWKSSRSETFWKQKVGGKGIVSGKDLIVGDLSYVERAVKACKDQSHMVERTKATIDGALLKGIPSNIDLFKELMLPFALMSITLKKLRKWEEPPLTVLFLAGSILIIYKNWLRFVCPAILLTGAVLVLTLRNLKAQGRLGDGFGRVTIREQPPSNTLQKILALKEALAEMELQVQKINIILLKLRTIALSGHPQATNEVLLALVGSALILLFVPFRYVCVFLLFDQFTYELEFRRGMVLKFESRLKEWWETIPASRVVVLPYERDGRNIPSGTDGTLPPTKGDIIAEAGNEWFAESH